MDRFQFVVIGAGPAGEAAAFKARERDATVAIVDRRPLAELSGILDVASRAAARQRTKESFEPRP